MCLLVWREEKCNQHGGEEGQATMESHTFNSPFYNARVPAREAITAIVQLKAVIISRSNCHPKSFLSPGFNLRRLLFSPCKLSEWHLPSWSSQKTSDENLCPLIHSINPLSSRLWQLPQSSLSQNRTGTLVYNCSSHSFNSPLLTSSSLINERQTA